MQFSTFNLFQVPPGMKDEAIILQEVELMKYMEDLGFDAVWIGEHHFRGEGVAASLPVLLAYVAGATKRIRLGSAISILPFTDPIRNAEDYATLDVLSGGRVNFGIGLGNRAAESLVWDIPFAELRDRFEEALAVILGAWTQDEFNFDGKYYRAHHLTLAPKPLQKPHPPIYQAASSAATEEQCAQRGIIPMPATFWPFPQLVERRERYSRAALAAGRSPAELAALLAAIPYQRYSHLAETDARAKEQAEAAFARVKRIRPEGDAWAAKRFGFELPKGFAARYGSQFRLDDWDWLVESGTGLFGSPERVVETILRMREEVGSDHIMLWEIQGDLPKEVVKKSLRLFAEKVIPHFK